MIKSRRDPPISAVLGVEHNTYNNQRTWHTFSGFEFSESVDSSNHPGWFTHDDGGGSFFHRVTEVHQQPSAPVQVMNHNGILTYNGMFACSTPGDAMPVGDGGPWASTAYAAMKPTKQPFSLLNMVYELKDLGQMLRSLQEFWSVEAFKKGIRSGLREVGSRSLGQLFGWNPMVNDVLTLVSAGDKIQKRIEWLIRNQGKWVKRRVSLRTLSSTSVSDWTVDYGALAPVLVSQSYYDVPSRQDTLRTIDKIWATAEFKYFLPDVPLGVDPRYILKRNLWGVRSPSAADLYRAVPWTWLIDWCFGLARVLENCDPGVADRLAARRFYVMREQQVIQVRRARGVLRARDSHLPVPVEASCWRRNLYQTRVIGLPFYPGNPNQLSGMQLAIMGALGLSRL